MFFNMIANPNLSIIQEFLGERILQDKPRLVVAAETVSEVQQLLQLAGEHSFHIMVLGSGSSFPPDLPIPKDTVALMMSKFETPYEWDENNLTVTVGAGIKTAFLSEALKSQGWEYRFIDNHPRITIGGMLASTPNPNQLSSLRTIMGFLLGIKVIHADSELVRWGGKMVKNVAGLDVGSLYIGSHGTLAVIVECTFRLVPFPSPLYDTTRRGHIPLSENLSLGNSSRDYLHQLHECFDPQHIFYQPTT
jgi:FAD/FMN-containing dehydrogenase